jgi:ribonuclease MRP protein subunit RMP1
VLADADFDLHRAFTTLVADNQYAPLGLMLLATLARVRRLILPLRGDTEDEDAEGIQAALEGIEKSGLDLGEVIKRGEIFKSQEDEKPQAGSEVKKPKDKKRERKGDEDEARSKAPAEPTPTKRPKKKRKKGDAFDDIFDSLI